MERIATFFVGIGGSATSAWLTLQTRTELAEVSWDVNGFHIILTAFVSIPTGLWMMRQIYMSFKKK